MGKKTSRYAANGPLGETVKEFGKLEEKLVTRYVFGILEGPDFMQASCIGVVSIARSYGRSVFLRKPSSHK